MSERHTFLAATVLLPVVLSLAQAHCGLPGGLLVGGIIALGVLVWFQERRQMRQGVAEQTQALRQELATLQRQFCASQLACENSPGARSQDDQASPGWCEMISQELRTPLQTIIGYSEMLQEEGAQMAGQEALVNVHELHEASQHLRRLIYDIHDLARIEAGTMECFYEPFELVAVIQEVLAALQPLMQERGYTCQIDVSPGLDSICTDRPKFRRSLENLLRHALLLASQQTLFCQAKHEIAPAGEWLVLHVHEAERPGASMMSACDGLEHDRSSILQRYGGAGLGLVLSQRLCRLMGGDLTFTGAGHKGMLGCMRLPCQTTVGDCAEAESVAAAGEAASAVEKSGQDVGGQAAICYPILR